MATLTSEQALVLQGLLDILRIAGLQVRKGTPRTMLQLELSRALEKAWNAGSNPKIIIIEVISNEELIVEHTYDPRVSGLTRTSIPLNELFATEETPH